jgi:hypothetical protein
MLTSQLTSLIFAFYRLHSAALAGCCFWKTMPLQMVFFFSMVFTIANPDTDFPVLVQAMIGVHVLLRNVAAKDSFMSKEACRCSLAALLAASTHLPSSTLQKSKGKEGSSLSAGYPVNTNVISSFLVGGSFSWLLQLLQDREVEVRCDAMLIVASLCRDIHGALGLMAAECNTTMTIGGHTDSDLGREDGSANMNIEQTKEEVVMTMIDVMAMTMLDPQEPFLVRIAAAKV